MNKSGLQPQQSSLLVNRIACKLLLRITSALYFPAASYLKRYTYAMNEMLDRDLGKPVSQFIHFSEVAIHANP